MRGTHGIDRNLTCDECACPPSVLHRKSLDTCSHFLPERVASEKVNCMGCKCSSLLAKVLHSFFGWVSYLPWTSAFCWLPMLAWQSHWLAVLALHYPSPNALSQTLHSDKRKTAQGGNSFVVSLGGPTSASHFRFRHSGMWWLTVLCQSGKWTCNSLSIECASGIGEISAFQLVVGCGRGKIGC